MSGESFGPSGESFHSKETAKWAAEFQSGDNAQIEHDTTPLDTSPVKQIERGEFNYDEVDSPDYVEVGHSSEMLQAVANNYFREQPRNARLVKHRYSQLTARDPELRAEEPRATVAIPIAIHNEDAATLRDTLAEVAAQAGVERDEIMLYGNMPDTLSEEEKNQARVKLDEVVAEMRRANPQLTLRSLVVEYDEDKLGIGRVRHDYMDLIAWDGARRGFAIDNPVIMLDADTKQMTKEAFGKLAAVLTAPDSDKIMAHTETHYLFGKNEQAEGQDGESDARKLAVLQEIRRRQYWRLKNRDKAETLGQDINEVYDQGHYDEEWGTAVALGPYLLVGGYNEQGKINESWSLTQRLYDQEGLIYDVMRHAKPDITSQQLHKGMYYLAGTSVRGSGRRHEQRLREWIAGGVNDELYAGLTGTHIQYGHEYQKFSHTDSLRVASEEAEPGFRDAAQAAMIIKAVLTPDAVERIDGGSQPLPDPTTLLRRLDLPRPDDDDSRFTDDSKVA